MNVLILLAPEAGPPLAPFTLTTPWKPCILGKTISGHHVKIAPQSNASLVPFQRRILRPEENLLTASYSEFFIIHFPCFAGGLLIGDRKFGRLLCAFLRGKEKGGLSSIVLRTTENETAIKIPSFLPLQLSEIKTFRKSCFKSDKLANT